MKQAHLAGRTRGLRPSQLRQAERLSHRRHPSDNGADPLTLERLADLCLDLKQPLHLLIDARGLCRLLWVGPLTESGQLLSHLPGGERRRTGDRRRWRLVSCLAASGRGLLSPEPREAVVALDLEPELWLRYLAKPDPGGRRPARGWQPARHSSLGWEALEGDDLDAFCRLSPTGSDTASSSTGSPPDRRSAGGPERVLLLTLTGRDEQRNERDLAELEGLVRSAGAEPVKNCPQTQSSAHPQTLWGTGKLQEAALEVRRHQASLVITDRELTPVQVRNLERWLDCPVMDRTELILDIFAQRAASAAGRLQVELAQLRYRLPRLIGRGRSLSRQGGGIGTRGPGETQLEKDRRAISRRIEALRRGLTQLRQHRARLRDRRGDLHRLALVGYTNAGKSSLLNALCGQRGRSTVLAENKLFATLDPTTRRLAFPRDAAAADVLLITDTVGFIRELPEALMEAFKATLEETLDADLLLLVVDLGDPDWSGQLQAVHSLLDALGCDQPRQVVANQIDRCDADALDSIRRLEPEVLYVSATSGLGLQGLKQRLDERFWGSGTRTDTLAPATDSTVPWPS